MRWLQFLVIIPLLIMMVLLAAIIVGTVISELLYPLAELGRLEIP